MNIDETVLYKRDASGGIRVWTISAIDFTIVIRYGMIDGAMQEVYEDVCEGKGNRDEYEQLMSRINSRINKQIDRGYVYDIRKVGGKSSNKLGFPKPMLAQNLKSVSKQINFKSAFIQRKYDGNRCLIIKTQNGLIAYSRNGKIVNTINHILDDIDIPLDVILDGELYCHGVPLQTIVSWIKRKQENNKRIKYHIYDTICELPFSQRYRMLQGFNFGNNIKLVETYPIQDIGEAMSLFKEFRTEGYEGAMLRWGDLGYEDDKRSKSLVKIKDWEDDEFYVVDIHPSKDGWGILECLTKNGQTFRTSAPGSIPEKLEVYKNRSNYFGKYVTIEYAYMTKDKIPFHPIAKCWRDINECK